MRSLKFDDCVFCKRQQFRLEIDFNNDRKSDENEEGISVMLTV